MHIPDGLIAPHFWVPAYVLHASLFTLHLRKIKGLLTEKNLPYLATLTAFSFVLSSIAFPLPGATSVHLLGFPILSLLFGPSVSYISYSLVLFLEATLLREGGITSYPINALCMAFIGSYSTNFVYKASKSVILSSFASVVISAFCVGVVLGLQPILFHQGGRPLYFPFPIHVVIPAIVLSHIPVGVLEAIMTRLLFEKLRSKLL